MSRQTLDVVVVTQNDEETIERSILSYYSYVSHILVSTDLARGWTGSPIVPDTTISRVRALDIAGKVTIVTGNYFKANLPDINETNQRQESADKLMDYMQELSWILQIDADEIFLDFEYFASQLRRLPTRTRSLLSWWLNVFNTTPDGRLLVVTDLEGRPMVEQFSVGHRPDARLEGRRSIRLRPKSALLRRLLTIEYKPVFYPHADQFSLRNTVLHFTFAKSIKKVSEKLATWSHAHQIEPERFFQTWIRSSTDWASLRNFHPITPTRWPALRPFTQDELLNYSGPLAQPFRHS